MKILGFAFLAVILLSGVSTAKVKAADTDITYKIFFQLDDEKPVLYKEVQGKVGDIITVRDTYYNKDTKKDYDFDGESKTQKVTQGKTEYTFRYKSYKAPSIKGSVSMVTSDGTILEKNVLTIEPTGNTTYTVPQTIKKNDKTYAKQPDTSEIVSVNYNSEKVDFTFVYKEVTNFEPYTVNVRYLDDTGRELQKKSFTVTGVDYIYYAPLTLKYSTGGETTYYNIANEATAKITHKANSTTREYNISYKKFDGKSTYTWYIYRYDGYTNQSLGEPIKMQVPVGKTVTYKPDASIQKNGTTYNLDGGMAKEYSHKYGDSERISYVYYNPEGYVPESNYSLTVEYRNIADNNVFYNTRITARPGSDTYISTPAEYQTNGIQYVRLDGQRDTISHSYYSPKRVYTIYYRDINDTEYEDTVITRVETVTTLETIDDGTTDGGTTGGGTAGGTGGGTAGGTTDGAAGDGTTTVGAVDGTTGDSEIQGVEGPDGSLVEAPDEDVPLANVKNNANNQNNMRFWLLGGLALLAAIGIAVIIMKKKRKAKVNEVE